MLPSLSRNQTAQVDHVEGAEFIAVSAGGRSVRLRGLVPDRLQARLVFAAPGAERPECLDEGGAELGERVLDLGRYHLLHLAVLVTAYAV
jgi:hypothetical protein